MPGVTREQIAHAKEWDLLSYLQAYEPQELRRCGKEYCTVSHDSLKISNGKWHWHSRGIGGRTALDYLVRVQGMDFVPAVEMLCGKRGAMVSGLLADKSVQIPPKPFRMPEANRYGTAMVSYLQGRGIDADIISHCIGMGILYESRRYHNCVFVGRDRSGNARYAFLRGTHGDFRQDVDGSDKRCSFYLPAAEPDSPYVAVAESPVDALSVASLLKMQGEDWKRNHYLSLGGTASRALIGFLRDHPAVTHVSLCLDNDAAGLAGMESVREAVRVDRELSLRIKSIRNNPPPESAGKDYNDLLQQKTAALRRSRSVFCRGNEKGGRQKAAESSR